MDVTLTAWQESEACTWCEREKECVTVAFADGFLASVPLCWRCLQKAVRVRNRTTTHTPKSGRMPTEKQADA